MTSEKKTRKTYSTEFIEEALKLTVKVVVAQAARELRIDERPPLHAWRSTMLKAATLPFELRGASVATKLF